MSCPACGAGGPGVGDEVVFAVADVPAQLSRLWPTAEAALAVPRGRVEIVTCPGCGFAWNRAFDARLVAYDEDYVDSQAGSSVFRAFIDAIADEAVGRLGRHPRRILEIGSGSGDVLRHLCARLGVPGVGYDPVPPSVPSGDAPEVDVVFERRLFDARADPGDADLVVCRHTLEHLPEPADLMADLVSVLGRGDALVYVEVPDTAAMLASRAFWDVHHEHVAYFDTNSLTALLVRAGLRPLDVRVDYGGQYLVAFARPAGGVVTPAGKGSGSATDPRPAWAALGATRRAWREALAGGARRRLVVWGATSRTTQLSFLVPELPVVGVCDINPDKWGRHLPGWALPVSAPAELPALEPDLVLAANPRYVDEIREECGRHGLRVPVVGLGAEHPPVPAALRPARPEVAGGSARAGRSS